MKNKQCVLCGKQFNEWGNNPWPLASDGRCCDECDCKKVIPARLVSMGHAQGAQALGEQLYREREQRKQGKE